MQPPYLAVTFPATLAVIQGAQRQKTASRLLKPMPPTLMDPKRVWPLPIGSLHAAGERQAGRALAEEGQSRVVGCLGALQARIHVGSLHGPKLSHGKLERDLLHADGHS